MSYIAHKDTGDKHIDPHFPNHGPHNFNLATNAVVSDLGRLHFEE
jgi:hypothetical protein